jgi:hypothetical protein
VSQGRAPLSQTESAKESGHYRFGAASPTQLCERFRTSSPQTACHSNSLLESFGRRAALGPMLWGSSSTTEGAGGPEGFETAIERAHLTLRLRCRDIDYGSSSSSDYGRVGRAGLDYVL